MGIDYFLFDSLRSLSTINTNEHVCTLEETRKKKYLAKDVLQSVYYLAIKKQSLSEYYKKEIGPLLEICLPAIFLHIESEMDSFPSAPFKRILELRSGLQYLLDDYKHFPATNGLLETSLLKFQSELEEKLRLSEFDKTLTHAL